jgi:hypothetical protein
MTEAGVVLEPIERPSHAAIALFRAGHRKDGVPELVYVIFAEDQLPAERICSELRALNHPDTFTMVHIEVEDDGLDHKSWDTVHILLTSDRGLWRVLHAAFDKRAFGRLQWGEPFRLQDSPCLIYQENENGTASSV